MGIRSVTNGSSSRWCEAASTLPRAAGLVQSLFEKFGGHEKADDAK